MVVVILTLVCTTPIFIYLKQSINIPIHIFSKKYSKFIIITTSTETNTQKLYVILKYDIILRGYIDRFSSRLPFISPNSQIKLPIS